MEEKDKLNELETRIINIENKLNEVLEKLDSLNSNKKYGPKSFYRSEKEIELSKRIFNSIP
jgi:hypothetical protein